MRTANDTKTGDLFKAEVENLLKKLNFSLVGKDLAFSKKDELIYSKNVSVGSTIYGDKFRVDFVINSPTFEQPLCIECRWQQVGGTVDQKYPYLVNNLKRTYFPSILILDGGGYKEAAKSWIFTQLDENFKNIFSFSEFEEWVMSKL